MSEGLVQGVRRGVLGRGTVWGLPRYERMSDRKGLSGHLCVNERGLNVIHSCGGGIHMSCKYLESK